MTGNPASTLAIHSDIHLDVSVDHESASSSLAPTTSTTAQIAMGDAMAVALMKMRNFSSDSSHGSTRAAVWDAGCWLRSATSCAATTCPSSAPTARPRI